MTSREARKNSSNRDSNIPILNRITVSTQATLRTKFNAYKLKIYVSYRNPNLQACALTNILYRVKVRTYNGNVIDALLLEYKIISKPWVFGPWVKESPILNKVPIQLVHCGHQWGHQHYGHPQGCGLPWVGDPSPGCHHGRDVLPQIRQVVHITFVQPSPCTLPNTKIYVH